MSETTTTRVAGYVRKSTDEAGKQIYSVDAQTKAISDLCQSRGWTLVRFYTDEGISGTIFERPLLKKLLADVKKGEFDLVLVVDFDRIARDSADSGLIRKQLALRGVRLAETSSPDTDSGSKDGKLMYTIKAGVAEYEHDIIVERTTRAVRYAMGKGIWVGRVPVGFELIEGRLQPGEDAKKVEKILWVSPKSSPAKIAKELGLRYYKTWQIMQNARKYVMRPASVLTAGASSQEGIGAQIAPSIPSPPTVQSEDPRSD